MNNYVWNVFFGVAISFSVYGMKLGQTLEHSFLIMPASIVHDCIQPLLSHQDVGRCRQVATWSSQLFDSLYACHQVHNRYCDTPACCVLNKNFYAATKALAYFSCRHQKALSKKAEREAEDCEALFQHIWNLHKSIREKDRKLKKRFHLDHQMKLYRKIYTKTEAIKRWIFEYSIKTVVHDDGVACKQMLSGTPYNIFDVTSGYEAEAMLDIQKGIELLFSSACRKKDFHFLRALCGGNIDGKSLVYVMSMSHQKFLRSLIQEKILSVNVADDYGRTPLHFAAQYGFANLIRDLMLQGAYVNGRDSLGRAPLHYAVKYVKVVSVQKLLEHPDVIILLKDDAGLTSLDYTKQKRLFQSSSSQKRYDRIYIRTQMQSHIDATRMDATWASHRRGYQEI